jgi:hypothetical protein
MNFFSPKKSLEKIKKTAIIFAAFIFIFVAIPSDVHADGHYTWIVSDGTYALYYRQNSQGQDILAGIAPAGSQAVGNYQTSSTTFTGGVDDQFLSQNLQRGTAEEGAVVDQYLTQQGGNDNYTNLYNVANHPALAKAGSAADQAYMTAFQNAYDENNPGMVAQCHTADSNPDYWNCRYNYADQQGDAANDATFNAVVKAENGGECIYSVNLIPHMNVGNCLAQGGYYILYGLSRILTLVGILFGLIISKTMIGMSDAIKDLQAINVGWRAFRDIANIMFIFVLLYISIATILRLSGYQAKEFGTPDKLQSVLFQGNH